jgi:hypothetical protein
MDRQEKRAEIIKKARALRSKGLTAKQTALELSNLGYVSPFSGKPYGVAFINEYTRKYATIPENEDLSKLIVSLRINGLCYKEIALELHNLGYKEPDDEPYSEAFLKRFTSTSKASKAILKAKAKAKAKVKKQKAREKEKIKADKRKARIKDKKQRAIVKALVNKLYKQGYPISHIELILKADGFINPNTSKPYSKSVIENLLYAWG